MSNHRIQMRIHLDGIFSGRFDDLKDIICLVWFWIGTYGGMSRLIYDSYTVQSSMCVQFITFENNRFV